MPRNILLIFFLMGSFLAFSQTNSDSLYFIKISEVYSSGLIQFDGDVLMLKLKKIPAAEEYDIVFSHLRRSNYSQREAILDTLSHTFKIFSVDFFNDKKGDSAKSMLTDFNNYRRGYLQPLDSHVVKTSSVIAYIIQTFTPKFEYVDYEIINNDCALWLEDCTVRIRSLRR